MSKNSLAPSGRGLRPQAVGERASRRHEGFGQRRGSLPPALRATAPPLAQAPPPPYRGSLSPRGRFFDTQTPAYHKQVHFCLEFHRFSLCKEGTKPRIIPSRPDTRGGRHRTPRPDDRASTFRRPAAHCTPRPGRSSTPPACGKAARAGTAYS